jgi:porin
VKHTTKKTLFYATAFLGLSMQAGLSQETAQTDILNRPTLQFGSTDAVSRQLEDDREQKGSLSGQDHLQRYNQWKEEFRKRTGISYTFDYSIGAIWPSNTNSGEGTFSSGAARFYGSWDLVGQGTKNTGSLIWKVEHRHAYSALPAKAAAGDIGYTGLIMPNFSDSGALLSNLYWKQNLNDGRLEIAAGMLDVTDWMDTYALSSPWTGFTNFAFSVGSATIPTPDDATLGVFVNGMITDNLYFVSGFTDSNSDSTNPLNGFKTFGEGEFFKTVELGWTTSQDRIFLDNVHLTLWHVDARKDAGVPDGSGVSFSYTKSFNEKFMPFFRAGYTEDGGSFLQKSVSTGIGYQFGNNSLLGFGLNWGQPNETTYGPGLKNQQAVELFTRLQVTENIQITPTIQYIKNPPLSTTAEDHSVLFGVRMRVIF